MRIALLSQWFAPEPDPRVFSLARELVSRGHQVTVLTGFPNYPHGKLYPGYKLRVWQREEMDGIRVIRLFLFPDHSRSVIKRSLNYLSFAISASVLGPMLCGPIDVLWVYHPPLSIGIPAWWISLLRRAPFVYEIQDMWPETIIATGMVHEGSGTRLLARLARFVYRRASAITVISPGFMRNLVSKGVPGEKIFVISNWADEEIFRPVERDSELGDTFGLTNHFNVLFSGNIGPAQELETVIEAAALLTDLPDVKFTLIGDGLSLSELKALVAQRNLPNVQFLGRQPMSAIPHFHAWADALLVHLRDDPLFRITIPSKTIAYLASGRPILCAVSGDGADVIRATEAGVVCPPSNPQALADMVRKLHNLPVVEREAMGQNGRQYFLEQYSCRALTDKYEAVFNRIARVKQ